MQEFMSKHSAMAKSKIKLDVGGQSFTASKETFLKFKDSFFFAMLSSGCWEPDEDGVYFIDRSPTYFPYVIDYLRTSSFVSASKLSKEELQCVQTEFDFYSISMAEVIPKSKAALKINTALLTNSALTTKIQSSINTLTSVYTEAEEKIAELEHKMAVCLFCLIACLVGLSVNAY